MTFERWSSRIGEATDTDARQALLGEIATWRAQRLTDVAAAREATWAMSRLHSLLGNSEAAVTEARSLLSLCKTPPAASEQELGAAEALLRELGEPVPGRPRARKERGERAERPERKKEKAATSGPSAASLDARQRALAATARGEHRQALGAIRGKKGPEWDLLRAWIQLNRSLATDDPAVRDADLRDLEARLRRIVTPTVESLTRAAAPARPVSLDDPLSKLLGEPVPRRRERRIERIETWLEANPERVDELASAALQHHVQVSGERSPAPWLAGITALALARGGERTPKTVAELDGREVFAVTAYREAPFGRLVALLKAALGAGWRYGGLRRGVLPRGEPAERRIWTLRLRKGGEERMVAVAPSADQPYGEELAKRLAERIAHLCSFAILLAPGPENADLRVAASEIGVGLADPMASDEAVLEQLAQVSASSAPRPADRPEPAERVEPVERRPRPETGLAQALEQGADPQALDAAIQGFSRPYRALQAASRLLTEPDDSKTAAVLQAIDRAAPAEEPMPEGTTMAVRAAAAGGEQSAALLQEGRSAQRYGGPGIAQVIEVSRRITDEGWGVHRVLRGATRRERRNQPVLETLGEHLQGLWRLLVRKGEVRGEIWVVAELPVEGRAALPQLLLEERNRAILLPDEAELLAWFATLPGPDAIPATAELGDRLSEALGRWS